MEIMEAVIQESEEGVMLNTPRVQFVEYLQRSNLLKPTDGCHPTRKHYQNQAKLDELKQGWASKFLKQGGLDFVIEQVIESANLDQTNQTEAQ